jgi:hypothetical protein
MTNEHTQNGLGRLTEIRIVQAIVIVELFGNAQMRMVFFATV